MERFALAAAVVLGFALTAALCSLFVPLRRVLERREQQQQPVQSEQPRPAPLRAPLWGGLCAAAGTVAAVGVGWLAACVGQPELLGVKYAELICEHFSDRVEYFSTINEPQIITRMGYSTGQHAPGLTLPDDTVLEILHSLAKAHAAAVRAMRKCAKRKIKIGFSSTGNLCYPSTGSKEDIEMAKKLTFSTNKEDFLFCHQIFCDAVILGKTCEYNRSWDDVETLNPPLDFLGLNIYNGHEVSSDGIVKHGIGFARTALKWPVTPEVLCWGPVFMYERYKLPIIITENGFSCNDHIFLDGKVHDADRIDYLTRYINELSKAIDAGTDVIGYFHWSFTDNLEWHSGYNERFGLVYIDYATGRRIPKDSFRWYSQLIRR